MKLAPNITQFLIRLGVFIIIFLLVTGIIGPWVVASKLLYGFHFFIYGNMGKLLIFSILAFFVIAREKIHSIHIYPYDKKNLLYIVAAFGLIPVLFSSARLLLQSESFTANLGLSLLTHAILVLVTILPVFGVFGVRWVIYFLTFFKKELLQCLAIAIVLYLAIFQVWKLWPYLADIVLVSVQKICQLFFPIVRVGSDRRILVQTFVVRIDEACSGIEGVFLFSCLYALIGFMDYQKLNKKKLFGMFLPSLLGLFATNVLRVAVLVMIGVLWSPKIALELFHTYAGLMFFVIYFIIFWRISYKWMMK